VVLEQGIAAMFLKTRLAVAHWAVCAVILGLHIHRYKHIDYLYELT